MVTFEVLPLGSYAPTQAPSPPFKAIADLLSWNGRQSCHRITLDVPNVIQMSSLQYFLCLRVKKEVIGGQISLVFLKFELRGREAS